MSLLDWLRRRGPGAPAAAEIPEGTRVYVIGDIHGRADLLESLARQIERDNRVGSVEAVTIFLGDYIDRGPSSAEVVDRLRQGAFPTAIVTLRGNHEQVMIDALSNPGALNGWRQFGGLETLASYRVDVSKAMRGLDYEIAIQQLNENVPAAHLSFLQSLPLKYELGGYFFCHAGVKPGVPLHAQTAAELLWIRDEFLNSPTFHGKVVVHGHTPMPAPEVRANRINIDTGAYATGILTALVLEGGTRRFFST